MSRRVRKRECVRGGSRALTVELYEVELAEEAARGVEEAREEAGVERVVDMEEVRDMFLCGRGRERAELGAESREISVHGRKRHGRQGWELGAWECLRWRWRRSGGLKRFKKIPLGVTF